MILDDMLTMLRRDYLHDRSDRVDGDDDQLWSDTTLIKYLDEAQCRMAERAFLIRDGSSPITRFVTQANVREYTLHPSIFLVLSMRSLGNGAYVNDVYTPGAFAVPGNPSTFVPSGAPIIMPDAADLGRGGHVQLGANQVVGNHFFDVNNLATSPPAKPQAFDTDEFTTADEGGSYGVMNARLYPMPSTAWAGAVMQMRVCRLPIVRLTDAAMTASPEIPERYHLALLDYAAYKALMIVDHEDGDADRAAAFSSTFENTLREARIENLRKMFAPTPWGFGRNGFSYVGN